MHDIILKFIIAELLAVTSVDANKLLATVCYSCLTMRVLYYRLPDLDEASVNWDEYSCTKTLRMYITGESLRKNIRMKTANCSLIFTLFNFPILLQFRPFRPFLELQTHIELRLRTETIVMKSRINWKSRNHLLLFSLIWIPIE